MLRFPTGRHWLLALLCIQGWALAFAPGKVFLVYSDRYAGSPVSAFGHVFLLFTNLSESDSFQLDFRDQMVNYGALTGEVSAFGYVWKGMTGGFSGRYSNAAFGKKIKEYAHQENRDLWFYELALTPDQRARLEAHLQKEFLLEHPYRFLDDNCAWRISVALETAVPGLRLNAPGKFWVLPTDILQQIMQQAGLVRHVWRVPSLRSRFVEGVAPLSSEQKDSLAQLLHNPPEALSQKEGAYSALLLELAMLRMDGQMSTRGSIPPAWRPRKDTLVAMRSRLPASSRSGPIQKDPPGMPHQSQRSSRITTGVSNRALELGYMPGYHGWGDPTDGLGMQTIEILSGMVSWHPGSWPVLHRAVLLDMASPSPWRFDSRASSWRLLLGERTQRSGRDSAYWVGAGLGIGVTGADHHERFQITAQGVGRGGRRFREDSGWKAAWDGGGQLFLRWNVTAKTSLRAEFSKTWSPEGASWGILDMGRYAGEWGLAWQVSLSRNWVLEGSGTGIFAPAGAPRLQESAISLNWFY